MILGSWRYVMLAGCSSRMRRLNLIDFIAVPRAARAHVVRHVDGGAEPRAAGQPAGRALPRPPRRRTQL